MKVISDAKILVANNAHKNFTESDEIIPAGSEVSGKFQFINGLRRGNPFVYRIFVLNDGRIIYAQNITPMTEVTLNADGPAKKIAISPCEGAGAIIVALAAFGYAKHKNFTTKKTAIAVIGGAVAGFVAGRMYNKTKKTK